MVEFVLDMADLRQKVNFTRNGLGAARTDLATQLVRMDVNAAKVVLFAANREMTCRAEMRCTALDEKELGAGAFSVMGNKLEKLIGQETEKVSFSVDAENAEVKAGFLTVNFETFDGASLKTIEQANAAALTTEGLTVPRAVLEEALQCARSCTTNNAIRPEVTHVELRGGRMLSSDGRKIMIYTHDAFPADMALKVPASALNDVLSAVKNIDAEQVQVFETPSLYVVKGNRNEFVLSIRKVERSFPAVEGQITNVKAPDDEVSVDKHVLEQMLRGVALGLPSEEVKVQMSVNGTGREAYLEVAATNSLGRRSHERASCGRKAKEGSFAWPVSFKHLLDTLSVFKGDSVVDMSVLVSTNLLMVRDTTETRQVLTVIPFRTDKAVEDERREADEAENARKKADATKTAAEATKTQPEANLAASAVGEELET